LDLPTSDAADLVLRLRAAGCVFAPDEARLLIQQAASPSELAAMVDRRVSGLPLEHVLGWVEFCGMRIRVEPGVFVPRRRTELLVELAAGLCSDGSVVVDMCCGSGAVGAAVLTRCPTVQVHASDVDPAAVRCARLNVIEPGGHVYEGDLFEALPLSLLGRVDVLVANAPYVPTRSIASMPAEARLHEPLRALDGGVDGLGVQRRIAGEAARWLAPDGRLLIETSEQQALATAAVMQEIGLCTQVMRSGELDATVVLGGPARA